MSDREIRKRRFGITFYQLIGNPDNPEDTNYEIMDASAPIFLGYKKAKAYAIANQPDGAYSWEIWQSVDRLYDEGQYAGWSNYTEMVGEGVYPKEEATV